ncbi:Uncharacterised protein [Mycobacteroides abscessus subsp. massiliense]|nr:Uncharacterised protein [Mycobacteroides abscessus subsp. massiliense]SKM99415.1 Uncharacterised protein [Mycobacteroides abscessus subsp. massiliense]SKN77986.1 Uncharacterised protein [Mycobacteroides abscessus subsp. massiliense]SKN95160.1 Uncharacterised protein [Mycobacteroides abscessus subsp. massiliense]SKO23199.1 Uncharacterised protein [Mycobacteroides abscessus subsp. massiliense]
MFELTLTGSGHTVRDMTTLMETWPEPDRATIGERLRAYMGVHKISRAKLSLASGISRTALGLKLDGLSPYTTEDCKAIGDALNKSWFWVLTGQELPAPDPGDGGPGVPGNSESEG